LPVRKMAICYSCGRRVAYTPCYEREALPEDARCNVLAGWLTVTRWKGKGSVDQYDFCSFGCLQKWVEAQIPKIPETFLDAFQGN
jgi:hypothetical protein